MAKPRVDYNGFRWTFFAQIAAEGNPDLMESFEASSWSKKDLSWMSLRDAMRSSRRLDPVVRALADLRGESFEPMRLLVLRRLSAHAKDRFLESTLGLPESLSFLYDVDPMLYAWFFLRRLINVESVSAGGGRLRPPSSSNPATSRVSSGDLTSPNPTLALRFDGRLVRGKRRSTLRIRPALSHAEFNFRL